MFNTKKTAISLVKSYKQRRFRKILFSQVLLAMMVSWSFQIRVEIEPVQKDKIYVYDPSLDKGKGANKDSGNYMDFTDGTWYFIPQEMSLEFHPNESGILVFSMTNCNDIIYLEAPKRVFIFPLEKHGGKTYVAKSNKKSSGSPNYLKIFPQNKEQLKDKEQLMFALQKYSSLFFTQQQIETKFNDWNVVPYYEPIKKDHKRYTWNNHFILLKGFKEWFKGVFQISPEQKDAFWKQESGNLNNVSKQLLASIMKFLFYDGEKMHLIAGNVGNYVPNLVMLQSIRAQDSFRKIVDSKEFIQALGEKTDAMLILNQISKELSDVAISLVDSFIDGTEKLYLQTFFEDIENGIDEHIEERFQNNTHFPYYKKNRNQLLDFTFQTDFNEDENYVQENTFNYKGEFKENFDRIKEKLITLFNNFYDLFDSGVAMQKRALPEDSLMKAVQDPQFSELMVDYFDVQEDSYKDVYKISNKSEYMKNFKNSSLFKLTVDLLDQQMLPLVLKNYEKNFAEQLKNWEPVTKMEFDLNDTESFQWFRRLLMIYGEIDYDPKYDDETMKTKTRSIFNVKSRLLMV